MTAENVAEYVEKAAMTMMVTSVQRALDAMRAGFEDVFTPPLAGLPSVLTAEDFTLLLSGSPEIDTAVLRSHCSVNGGTPEFATMFWDYVDSLTPVDKAKLLAFWTGSACVPSDLSSWQIKVEVKSASDALPTSATCFHRIRIPAYATAEELRAKLQRAVLENTYQMA